MKRLNNALNEVHDNYIEEAAKADHLEKSTAKTVRNIAIPVTSVAAVAGICLGLNAIGVFGGKQGVELLPADSGSSSNASTSQTVPNQPNDYQYELIGYLPAEMPLVLQTQSDIESRIFRYALRRRGKGNIHRGYRRRVCVRLRDRADNPCR